MRFFLIFLLLLHPKYFYSQQQNAENWERVSRFTPYPNKRRGALISLGKELIVIGGISKRGKISESIWSSVDDGETWKKIVSQVPFGLRENFAYAVLDKDIFIAAGCGTASRIYSDVWKSSDAGRTWKQIVPHAPFGPRGGARMLALNKGLYLIGGRTEIYNNDVWESLDRGETWTQVNGTKDFPPRALFGAVVYNKDIIVTGGINASEDTNSTRSVWKSSDAGRTWHMILKKTPFYFHSGCMINFKNNIFVIFGFTRDKVLQTSIFKSTNGGISWVVQPYIKGLFPRADMMAATNKNYLFLSGGGDDDKRFVVQDLWRYSIDKKKKKIKRNKKKNKTPLS